MFLWVLNARLWSIFSSIHTGKKRIYHEKKSLIQEQNEIRR